MKDIAIIEGLRTPIGNLGGALKEITNQKMGETIVRELLKRSEIDPALIEEVIFGCVGQYSDATNLSRVIALMAGLPITTPAYTVARNCASGMQAVVNACQNIICEDADVQVAGGVENMSLAPFVSRDMRFGQRLKHSQMIDTIWEGLTDGFCGQIMGNTAENLAEEFKISRQEQDQYAVESHKRAFRATREGKFRDEILPISIPKRVAGKEVTPEIFAQDEGPNIALTEQMLGLYPTIFKEGGSVTPGNACPISDGAAALVIMSGEKATELGKEPLGYVRSYASVGVEPSRMGIGPAIAIPAALKKAKLSLSDIELIEVNEAFAVQYLAVERELKLKRDITNVNGGAIALGHPVGMSGTRLIITLLKEMKRRNLSLGVASLCVGGGLGSAMVLERK
ncbi:3-ketoacyl-CoA thiolase @ Acetyl-CoA acetyltransferase [hydrothermal vent metagenome]|uniref:3-ketoacyl-CoA thiolase @ Acetyl-CoA acetyltransferase n=1 Tax=hydrothermal vent metagenome TaxID=652676 RepID=A0A3B1DCR8_9ZZZZ